LIFSPLNIRSRRFGKADFFGQLDQQGQRRRIHALLREIEKDAIKA
jgi:hypothetical protein